LGAVKPLEVVVVWFAPVEGLVVVLLVPGVVVVFSVPNDPGGRRLGSIVGGVMVPAGCVVPAVGAVKLRGAAAPVVALLPVSDA
jgi:hypothetical protein